jgi:ribosomal-protein-alanine N-acetyltransferase
VPSFIDLTLRTARLRLRPLTPADAPALLALCSDPVVMRHGSSAPWSETRQALDSIKRDRRCLADGSAVRLAITRPDDDLLLGTCSLFALDAQCRRAEVGYQLARQSWGQGYAHEAVSALIAWGLDALDLNRIEADVDPRNAASVRALERLGFVREGHLRERWIVAGEVCDSLLFGLLAADWRARG